MPNRNQLYRSGTLLVVASLLALTASGVHADPPSIFSMFQRKLPTDDAALELKTEHGPWLVLAHSISASEGRDKAYRLAKEIRSTMNLPTFVVEKTIDNSGVLGSSSRVVPELDGSTTQYRRWSEYANGRREQVFAVMVGEFTSLDDPRIKDTLKAIKTAQPNSLQESQATNNDQSLRSEDTNWVVKKYRSMIQSKNEDKKGYGPMATAFVIRNPLLPDEYFMDTPKVDQFIEDLNGDAAVKFSLLKASGKYTVRVASFTGKEVTDFGGGNQASKMKDEPSDALKRAAFKANKLTAALRKDGVEAYEFHDYYGSYVMIGSFDTLGSELTAGDFQYHPEMVAIMRKYCGYEVVTAKDQLTGAISQVTSLKQKDLIPFDLEGKPMAIPRPESRKLYGGSLLGRH